MMTANWLSSLGVVVRLACWLLLTGSYLGGLCKAEDGNPKRVDYAMAIDALASKNPEPQIVQTERGYRPLFAKAFDWEDQLRVRKALARLCKDDSEDLWNELAKHTRDKRYAITMTMAESVARNYSVGSLCEWLLEWRVTEVYERYLVPVTDEKLVDLSVPIDCNKWRKQGMSIREMQVRACELASKAVPAAEGISEKAKREMQKNIDAECSKLKRSRTAEFEPCSLDAYDLYNSEDAERFRNEPLKK